MFFFTSESDFYSFLFIFVQNFRYRFRLINAEFLNCPIEVSVDNHTLYVVSSDGRDIEPVQGMISPLQTIISLQNRLSFFVLIM